MQRCIFLAILGHRLSFLSSIATALQPLLRADISILYKPRLSDPTSIKPSVSAGFAISHVITKLLQTLPSASNVNSRTGRNFPQRRRISIDCIHESLQIETQKVCLKKYRFTNACKTKFIHLKNYSWLNVSNLSSDQSVCDILNVLKEMSNTGSFSVRKPTHLNRKPSLSAQLLNCYLHSNQGFVILTSGLQILNVNRYFSFENRESTIPFCRIIDTAVIRE